MNKKLILEDDEGNLVDLYPNDNDKKPMIITEDLGKIFEMAICLLYETPFDGKFKYSMLKAELLKDKIANLLYIGKAGCHNQRTKYIWDFSSKFWANPEKFKKTNRENWFKFRNRLSLDLWGIGLAKTSFALELCYPEKCQAVYNI